MSSEDCLKALPGVTGGFPVRFIADGSRAGFGESWRRGLSAPDHAFCTPEFIYCSRSSLVCFGNYKNTIASAKYIVVKIMIYRASIVKVEAGKCCWLTELLSIDGPKPERGMPGKSG